MELVACIWPIIELPAGIIRRFAARAYAMPEDEGQISQALRLLATSDYLLARQFPVPKNLRVTSPHGEIEGAIPFAHYNDQDAQILEMAFVELEKDKPPFVGVGMGDDGPYGVPPDVSFPSTPYVITTFLEEDERGRLTVLHARSSWED